MCTLFWNVDAIIIDCNLDSWYKQHIATKALFVYPFSVLWSEKNPQQNTHTISLLIVTIIDLTLKWILDLPQFIFTIVCVYYVYCTSTFL